MVTNKIIFHLDIDSFFVSCETILRPELEGKDIAISYNKSYSIASSLSYSAKQKGAKVPMKNFEIKKFCPEIINVKPNYFLYETISKKIFNFLRKNYTNEIEIGSIDEWYLDVTKFSKKFSSPFILAQKIQNDIFNTFKLNVSIGVSYNKFLAKMATDLNKPKGITILKKNDIPNLIWPLNIQSFVGIGKSLSKKMINEGILTIGDLAKINKNDGKFLRIFKNKLNYYIDNANGIGDDKINLSYNESISIGAQKTFDKKYSNNISEIYMTLKIDVENIVKELENRNIVASHIGIIIKTKDKKLINSSYKTVVPLIEFEDIYEQVLILFNKIWNEEEISMIGVNVSCFKNKYKINDNNSLFNQNEKNIENKILEIINKTNKKIKSNNLKLLKDKKE